MRFTLSTTKLKRWITEKYAFYAQLFSKNRSGIYIIFLVSVAAVYLSTKPYFNLIVTPVTISLLISLLGVFLLKINGEFILKICLGLFFVALVLTLVHKDKIAEQIGEFIFINLFVAVILLIRSQNKNK